MANLTNSAKLIEEMEKKAYTSDLGAAALSNQYQDLDGLPTLPTVNDSTIKIQKNSADVDSFTTNAASGKTINITLTAADVGLGNVDNTSDLNKPISTATQTALNAKANSADVYTSAQTDSAISSAIDSALSSVFVYKGSKASYDQLPTSGNKKGDVWNVEAAHTTDPKFDAGTNVAWNGSGWDPLAGTIDLSAYATTVYVDGKISDAEYGSSWDTDTSHAPSKNAVYDKLNAVDTAIAGKQDTLSTQTAYSAKGSATKVPQITTNTLGQVTGITEVTIEQPDISGKADKTEVLTKTNTTSFTPTGDYHPATKKYVDDVAASINSAEWGNITGTLADQTDLQTALDSKVGSSNNTINNVVHLSQAEYDALGTKDPNTWYSTPDDASGGFDPENTGSTGQFLTRTATGYDWESYITVPSGGATGQVLTKTQSGASWENAQSGLPEGGTEGQFIRKTAGGSEWVDGELVEITEGVDDYSAMRGPCDEGYHIPLSTEMTSLINTGVSLGAWTTSSGFNTYLKIPLAGAREGGDGNTRDSGTSGYYWCSDKHTEAGMSKRLYINSSGTILQSVSYRFWGLSIRPFKDIPVIPDSSWVVLYQGTGSAGIYHNATLGLISISSDGENWITIVDKNLGATTVWDSGATLSESNCGKYYQWGNNYGFPFTGSITTSSSTVNTNGYGPGNYYSSSTFITNTSGDWSSPQNDNLRGGETGITTGGTTIMAGETELAGKDYVDDMLGDVESLLAAI